MHGKKTSTAIFLQELFSAISLLLVTHGSCGLNSSTTMCVNKNAIENSTIIIPTCQAFLLRPSVFIYMENYDMLIANLHLLEIALKNGGASMYCGQVVTAYVCNYVYPSCNELEDGPVGICEDECKRFILDENPCTPEFEYLVTVNGVGGLIFQRQCNNTLVYVQSFLQTKLSRQIQCINITVNTSTFSNIVPSQPAGTETGNASSNTTTGEVGVAAIAVPVSIATAALALATLAGLVLTVYRLKRRKKIKNKMLPSSNMYQLKDQNSSSHETALFQLVNEDVAENPVLKDVMVSFQSLVIADKIGNGAFGNVFKGKLHLKSEDKEELVQVAVKTIKNTSASYVELKGFLEESVVMCGFDHPHVLGLIGICLDPSNSPHLLLPFMKNGDLRTYLRNRREKSTSDSIDYLEGLECEVLLRMCQEIAQGMEYLASKRLVHRDVAARNCMVDGSLSVRVADFGLTRDIYETDYYRQSHQGRVPIKWMALESLHDRISNEKTDVWSYGVTCWEIFSLGRTPYPTIANADMLEYLEEGGRLRRPNLCPNTLHLVLATCWKKSPQDRPSFSEMCVCLDTYDIAQQFSAWNTKQLTNTSVNLEEVTSSTQFLKIVASSSGEAVQTQDVEDIQCWQ